MKSLSAPIFSFLFLIVMLILSSCQSFGVNPKPVATLSPLPGNTNPTQPLPVTGKHSISNPPGMESLITIQNQDISGGKVVIDQVVSQGPGWVVIHRQAPDGTPGEVIGYASVKNGVNDHVAVSIQPGKATSLLIAMLHRDAGKPGVYEYPGADVPVVANGQVVLSIFKATSSGGGVAEAGGTPVPPAQAPGLAGATKSAGATATANSIQGMNNMANMAPSTGTPAAATPAPTLISIVNISDQPVQNGTVKVNEVVSNGPGWIVIYSLKAGQPDTVIGYAPVHAGDNKDIRVSVDVSKAGSTLEGRLHLDTGQSGVFEYPGPDVPVVVGLRIASAQFKNSAQQAANPGGAAQANSESQKSTPKPLPYVSVINQPIHQGMVIIPEIYSDGVSWIVIHPSYPDGTIGNFIGYALLHDGLNKNVRVRVNTSRTTRSLLAMLHLDVSKASVPQYPGPDVPLMVNGQMVAPLFNVLALSTRDFTLSVYTGTDGVPRLVDSFGMSLYTDLPSQPQSCSADNGCPFRPLLNTGVINVGDGVAVDKIGMTSLADGNRQITYGGVRLYYNINDQIAGDANGQGVDNRWNLVTP